MVLVVYKNTRHWSFIPFHSEATLRRVSLTCLLSFSLQPCSLIWDPAMRSTTVRHKSMCLTDLSLVKAHSWTHGAKSNISWESVSSEFTHLQSWIIKRLHFCQKACTAFSHTHYGCRFCLECLSLTLAALEQYFTTRHTFLLTIKAQLYRIVHSSLPYGTFTQSLPLNNCFSFCSHEYPDNSSCWTFSLRLLFTFNLIPCYISVYKCSFCKEHVPWTCGWKRQCNVGLL